MSIAILIKKYKPLVSVIIPSLDGYRNGNVPKLIEAIKGQTFHDLEVILVKGVMPCARAHNAGVNYATGKIIVFFDDDIILGHDHIIENLIAPFAAHQAIGITGASQLLPPDANRFQKRCNKEFDRFQFPVINEMIESDMATHAAMAIRKNVFMKAGQENVNLIYGDDPEFRARLRQAGYKIVVVPQTWIYHPPPKNLISFLRISFQRGKGAAHDFLNYPDLIYETPPANAKTFVSHRSFLYRVLRAIIQNIEATLKLKLIFLSVRISYEIGYGLGLLREIFRSQSVSTKDGSTSGK
ncbi:MAG: glycosyltransferase [Planctomycetota bacterium]